MLNPFAIEREIFSKIDKFEELLQLLQMEVSHILLRKSEDLRIELTEDLKERCGNYMQGTERQKKYECRVCGKLFDDGRKLGGHVSRAHKGKVDLDPDREEDDSVSWKKTKPIAKAARAKQERPKAKEEESESLFSE